MILPVILFTGVKLHAQEDPEVNIHEHLGDTIPKGIVFRDESGRPVEFKSLIHLPTILVLIYYDCPGICPTILGSVSDVIERMDYELGKDYQIITISFDSREGSELAGKKRENYLKKIRNAGDSTGWIFLTGDSLNIQRITQSAGFGFKLVGTEYMHEGALIFLSPEGKITRYLKGISFLPFEFKLAVIEASQGKSGATVGKVIQFCFSYDPGSQHYVMDITKVSAIVILFFALVLLAYLLIKSRKKNITH